MTAQIYLNVGIGRIQRFLYPWTMYIHISASVIAKTYIGQILSFISVVIVIRNVYGPC